MDSIQISQKTLSAQRVIEQLLRHPLTEREAAELVGKSVRHVRRMKARVQTHGVAGLVHGNRGKTPWNKRGATVVSQIATLYETKYYGFNCLHFQDMLGEREGIAITRESLRSIFLSHGFPRRKHRSPRRYERRDRKPQPGMLIQQDTSIHDWFGTGVPCSLIASIDDATNEVVFAKFFPTDGTLQNMEAMKTIGETKGIPAAFYVDRASHFKTTRHESIHVELSGTYDETQIARALSQAGSTCILALSPQAKGRVERLFETLQDRLVKELALEKIITIEGGNQFLMSWIPTFNRRFMVPATNPTPAYRSAPNHLNLNLIFSVQEERVVKNDNTISFEANSYLLHPSKTRVSFAKTVVTVHQCINGGIRILYKGEELAYTMGWTKSLGNS